jgi:hypothetical protein
MSGLIFRIRETLPQSKPQPGSQSVKALRETNTMPSVGRFLSGYYPRYLGPKNTKEIVSTETLNYWGNPGL